MDERIVILLGHKIIPTRFVIVRQIIWANFF